MKFLLVLILILFANYTYAFGQNNTNDIDSTKDSELNPDAKVHPILIKWKNSENSSEFAQQNNLSFKDETVRVYIHLTSAKHLSSIASEAEIISSYKKTVDAFVSSDQIDNLKHLEYVEKISLPEYAKTPPIPTPPTQTQQPESPVQTPQQETQEHYLFWIIPAGLTVLIVFIIKVKKQRNPSNLS